MHQLVQIILLRGQLSCVDPGHDPGRPKRARCSPDVPAAEAGAPARRRHGSVAEAGGAAAAEGARVGSGAAGAAGGGPLAGMRFLVTGMDAPRERARAEAALRRCGGCVLDAIPPADVRSAAPAAPARPILTCMCFLRLQPGRPRVGRAAS